MYPYNCRPDPTPEPDRSEYEFLAETMSDIVYSVHGEYYGYGPVYSTIYPSCGGSVDWVYVAGGVNAFTYELRDRHIYGFLLPWWQIRPNCEEILPALLFYAEHRYPDCNGNDVYDILDIANGTSDDCNANDVPDECEPGGEQDCNGNTIPDLCDIFFGTSVDCNGNDIPDECDLADDTSPDCNGNDVPDECDISNATSGDCNGNDIPDECDLADCDGSLWCEDCQPNGVMDICEPTPMQDNCADAVIICPNITYYGSTIHATNDGAATCGDSNSTPDVWYYYQPSGYGAVTISLCGSRFDTVLSVHSGCPGTASNQLECNDDWCGQQSRLNASVNPLGDGYWIRVSGKGGSTGEFQMSITGPACAFGPECNDNGIPDECEPDCNGNGQPDDCDIADQTSQDANGNGFPDECELAGDLDCDGSVSTQDIEPFVLALVNPDTYQGTYRDCVIMNADCNGDGSLNGLDIDPFVALLAGQ
jgi:hypothetical protein